MKLAVGLYEHLVNESTLVIQGGTLMDGTGKPPVENSVIVIEGDRFKAVSINGGVVEDRG
jgi:hypothetical protein